jgi:poly-gamma-glutamate synthesis protein (capsule biosynthesis protein)
MLPDGWNTVEGSADLTLDVAASDSPGGVDWIYALAAPFPTVPDGVSAEELRAAWNGGLAGAPAVLLVDPSTLAVFEQAWGTSGPNVRVVEAGRMLDTAWRAQDTWAILPFEALEPRWKVLTVDGNSPIRKDFDPAAYPLRVRFAPQGSAERAAALQAALPEGAPLALSNLQPDHLTTVMLTGVTALVRGTASLMEVLGMTYPASDIGPWLREADILHISNEVPFARNCPQPFDWKDLVFCSQTEYIQLLEDVGADVIELTGDHFADWGPEAMLYTVSLYKERGWPYYGGGENLEDAQRPVTLEHNGNKIAFLGCNGKEPGYATASATMPGAAHCDLAVLTAALKDLRAQGYQPIFTFQHLEYYQYVALPPLQTDFHTVADAGAVIVSGSQAHQPHAFEYRDESFLHYGLGNLFFDQTNQGEPPRTAFIDRHVFYGNRHISTELLTIYFVDYARARPMTPDERRALLETVFQASGWEIDQTNQP